MRTQQSRPRNLVRAHLASVAAMMLIACTDGAEPVGPPSLHDRVSGAALTGPLAVTSVTGLEPMLGAVLTWSQGNDISDLGHVVGTSGTPSQSIRAAVWEPGTLFPTALGELPGGGENAATAVNSAGTIIVGIGEIPGGDGHAVRWVNFNGTWIVQDLGTVEFGGTRAMAHDIADDGTIVGVDYADPGPDNPRGFVWRNGVMTDLGPFGVESANAVNNDGQVVGINTDNHAVLWTPAGGPVDLGTLGGNVSIANDINASGEVVGEAYTSSGKRHAFLWTSKRGMIDLGPPDAEFSTATGINAEGSVVGYVQSTPQGPYHAFLWSKGKMLDLGVLPGYEGGDSFAHAINTNGQVVGMSRAGAAERGTLWTMK